MPIRMYIMMAIIYSSVVVGGVSSWKLDRYIREHRREEDNRIYHAKTWIDLQYVFRFFDYVWSARDDDVDIVRKLKNVILVSGFVGLFTPLLIFLSFVVFP